MYGFWKGPGIKHMKIIIEIDTDSSKNDFKKIHSFLNVVEENICGPQKTVQRNINNNNTGDVDKVICSKCGENIYDLYDKGEATKVINFCKIKYKKSGNVYCRKCQETIGGGEEQ